MIESDVALDVILTYKEMLNKIQGEENHLLLANGFNRGLGINTGYPAIFKKMAENNKEIYNDALSMVEDCNFDLECFIGKLEKDIKQDNAFLKKYISNKIKLDFMQATHEIVKSEIKNIYAEKNEGVFILLKEFTNYFTLNYDSFLYLLLLKYKPLKDEEYNAIVLQPSIKFIEEDLNEQQNSIYHIIKTARTDGILTINVDGAAHEMQKEFNLLTKAHFTAEIKEYNKNQNIKWKAKDIDRVINYIWEEEKQNACLDKVDDGSKQLELFEKTEIVFDTHSITQNLFFLHGAFHIYKDGKLFKKITQKSDKSLYEKLEDVLNNEEQEVVCVFQHINKIDTINNNEYLKHCLDKLGSLSGNLVIIGSSLADNDDHIFEQIDNSSINNIYISVFGKREDVFKRAKCKFPSKNIYLFAAETISYEMPEENPNDTNS